MVIQGVWGDDWSPVVDAFAANFDELNEQGAGLAIYHQGKPVLNIWAGVRDNRQTGLAAAPWEERTLVNIFSAGKGLVALCVLQLVAGGKLNLDKPVAHYWPGFGQAGKADITVGQLLSHRSGLSAFHQRIADEQIFDWHSMIQAIEQEAPWWEPGSAQGYSPFMYGWMLGELVRRVSGATSFDDYFQENVAKPLAISCYFGVADNDLVHIADIAPLRRPLGKPAIIVGADSVALGKLMKADPRGVTNRAFSNPLTLMTSINSQSWRQAQIPAANAHCNALALAAVYGDLACGNPSLLPSQFLPLAWQEQSFGHDQVLGLPLRFSQGFMLSQSDRADCRYGRGSRAFGHPGAGGCIGFADPDYQIGFGYVTNRMGQRLLIDERAVRLIDAIYNLLGA